MIFSASPSHPASRRLPLSMPLAFSLAISAIVLPMHILCSRPTLVVSAPLRLCALVGPRSGAPRRSRIARVRSVPSFIAMRPCFEMKSSASWYVNVSAPAPELSLEGVLDQHRPRHRPDSPRVWRQPARNRIDTGPEVADLASTDRVRAHIHHDRARLDHLPADEVGVPRSADEDVRRLRVIRKTLRPRVAYRHC